MGRICMPDTRAIAFHALIVPIHDSLLVRSPEWNSTIRGNTGHMIQHCSE